MLPCCSGGIICCGQLQAVPLRRARRQQVPRAGGVQRSAPGTRGVAVAAAGCTAAAWRPRPGRPHLEAHKCGALQRPGPAAWRAPTLVPRAFMSVARVPAPLLPCRPAAHRLSVPSLTPAQVRRLADARACPRLLPPVSPGLPAPERLRRRGRLAGPAGLPGARPHLAAL